jgi:hypothetical protein
MKWSLSLLRHSLGICLNGVREKPLSGWPLFSLDLNWVTPVM